MNLEDTVEGDIVYLSGNQLVPGDVYLLESENLQIGWVPFLTLQYTSPNFVS